MLQKTLLLALLVLIGCVPLLVSYNVENSLGCVFSIYRYTLYFVYISCVILFSLTIFRDIIWSVVYGVSKILRHDGIASPFCHSWLIKLNLISIVISLIVAISALHEGTKIPEVNTIEINSDKIKQAQTIAVLSDLHIHRVINPFKIKEIVEKVNAQNPDIILLNGDIIDDDVARVAPITALLKGLKAKNGIYFVTGNHEFYAGYKETVAELQNLGFTFLENNGQSINKQLYLAGIPDWFSAKGYGVNIDVDKAFKESQPQQYRLLMSHTPADFGIQNNFDLEVSGHTHGGQIFPFHILTKLYNKYLSGLYQMDSQAQIYVTNGAGQWGPQMRFLAPSEISVIKLNSNTRSETMKKSDVDTVFDQGDKNPYGEFFTGQTYLTMLNLKDEVFNSPIGNVTFEPAARTNWHKHSGGQILLVTGGEGRYQERGKAMQILHKGDVVRIAPNVEHWHGAAPDSWFVHISIETNGANNKATWLEPVTDSQYNYK